MENIFFGDKDLFISHKNINTLVACMNVGFDNVSAWFKLNKLSLNLVETIWSLLHFLSKRKFPQILPNLVIENLRIKREIIYISETFMFHIHRRNPASQQTGEKTI